MITLAIVTSLIAAGLAAYYLAGAPRYLRIRREGRAARQRQEQQYAASIAGTTPDEAADLTPAGNRGASWAA